MASHCCSCRRTHCSETEEGRRPIEDVDVGDRVWARNPETGEEDWREVTAVFVTPDKPVMELELVDDANASELLHVTGEHPFWVAGRGFGEAARLEPGDEVYTSRGGWVRGDYRDAAGEFIDNILAYL
ncbi:hypothetical protein FIV42_00090 [Persicimonas caeni]|uniref:Hint domain-containing protein n=1 Tax=Persicimonas caeni TaxID=2292766 RepID=A0A4Y6PLQ2_PERCE|nr:polymorphic toxin-type HINT domain-containing protein [Persicimonas caeni]QDG49192.1 hypothetical protein FIV42_00090 [Persicimonas caeni]QED30413.1 hypothetical protein FRD00_00085 [Persicimonas caeni]